MAVQSATPPVLTPLDGTERIASLDTLRGLALYGMILVHCFNWTGESGEVGTMLQNLVSWLVESKAHAVFALLFGAGFAIQLRRAEAAGGALGAKYLRRLFVLFVFGFVAEAFFGYNVLIEYAVWGVPLLLVRNWSTRSLLFTAVLCAISLSLYFLLFNTSVLAMMGPEEGRAYFSAMGEAAREHRATYQELSTSENYAEVVAARLWHMPWFYTRPFSFTPQNTFTLFLLGFIAMRMGLFEQARRRLRLIVGLMIFGVVAWIVATWLLPIPGLHEFMPRTVAGPLSRLMGILRDQWLAFTYIGSVLLLFAYVPRWAAKLAPVGSAGRMALTNYIVQVVLLDLLFSNYAIGLKIDPFGAVAISLVMFGAMIVFSRRWLKEFRFGPLEWLWRTLSYGRKQPMRLGSTTKVLAG